MTSTERRRPPVASPLDLDGLDALIEERDHLLRSLDDLEQEHDAGDVDDTDYLTLRDDYTARAAAVIRRIEAKHAEAEAPKSSRSWRRTFGWVAGIAVFAVLAGVLVAQMSGSRRDGETITGSTRDSTRALIADATNAFQQGDLDDAISLYTRALELSPADTEALTYRGWAQVRAGDVEAALRDLDQAVEINDSYLDARVFRAVTLAELERFDEAASDLRAFDELQPTQLMRQIVTQNFLRERIVAGVLLAEDSPSLADSGFTADQVVVAAEHRAEIGEPAEAARLLDVVLAAEPDNVEALAARGWVLARVGVQAGDTKVTDRGLADIDAALAIDPDHPGALVYRSFTLMFGYDDTAGAKAALDQFDALAEKPEALVALVESYGLRTAISSASGG